MSAEAKLPKILDCTIRDGGYITNWHFEERLVRDLYRDSSKAGVDYIELGYHGTERFFDPAKYGVWRFSPEEKLRAVVAGIQGAGVALMVDHGKFDPADIPSRSESVVSLIRLAVHRNQLSSAVEQCQRLKELGYEVSLQLMGYATYSDAERNDLARILRGAPLDYVYVADSYGSVFPDQVESFLETLVSIGGFEVGFHPHNHLQMGFANTLQAIRCGVSIVDASIYGIGRAAGNLPLEILVAYLQTLRPDRYNVLPLLDVIDRYFLRQMQETPWGYQLAYMLSGLFNVHPDYAKDLIERREYTTEDIWKALQIIAQKGEVGYSKPLVNNLIQRGLVGSTGFQRPAALQDKNYHDALGEIPKPNYVNRYQGGDILVLGNGPTLQSHATQISDFVRRYQPVILGANYLGGLFVPTYHAFTNKRRFMSYVQQVHPDSKLLLGTNFEEKFIREYTNREFEQLSFYNEQMTFGVADGIVTCNCRTVSVLLCAVAAVMGAKRIFVVGLDGYVGLKSDGKLHFYAETDESVVRDVLLEKHTSNYFYLDQVNKYAEAHGIELHILTPTSYARFYKGISNYLAEPPSLRQVVSA